jgi:hypothetical protein
VRLAYVCYWDLESDDGVSRKIRSQVAHWREAGHDVKLEAIRPAEGFQRVHRTNISCAAVRKFAPEVVYVRYDLFAPSVWSLAQHFPTGVELNSDDRAEWLLRSKLAAAYNAVNRRALLRAAAGVVAVSGELAPARHSALVLGNGMDPRDVPALQAPSNERPRIAFIGSPRQPWHGVDKIVELARLLPELDVDVIGPRGEELDGASSNVYGHGVLPPSKYRLLLEQADAAVGTLALHRKRMREASPLKVREYLLSGIPTMIAYDDTDLRGIDAPWLLRLPNVESNVRDNVEAVRAFLKRARGLRVPRADVEQRLDSRAKERQRLEYLERLRA